MVVEAKYNGEHWGAPYAIAGGWLASFGSVQLPGLPQPAHALRFPIPGAGRGTHRIFRQASYARTRRTVQSLAFSPAVRGFTLEPPQAYFPQRDGYHAQDSDRFSPWTFARDEMMFLLWGRLSYDPDTPEDLFRAMLARETGGDFLWDTMQAASEIVPWIQTVHTCGPDSRNFAPELELGGDVGSWATPSGTQTASCYRQGAFDSFAIAGPDEVAADLIAGSATSRLSPVEVAARVLEAADRAALAGGAPDDNLLARDIVRECHALADLGQYFGHKLRGATALAVYQRVGLSDWLSAARAETATADDAWRQLADDTSYIRPFADHLRMLTIGYDPFHWSEEVPALDADPQAIDASEAQVSAVMPVPACDHARRRGLVAVFTAARPWPCRAVGDAIRSRGGDLVGTGTLCHGGSRGCPGSRSVETLPERGRLERGRHDRGRRRKLLRIGGRGWRRGFVRGRGSVRPRRLALPGSGTRDALSVASTLRVRASYPSSSARILAANMGSSSSVWRSAAPSFSLTAAGPLGPTRRDTTSSTTRSSAAWGVICPAFRALAMSATAGMLPAWAAGWVGSCGTRLATSRGSGELVGKALGPGAPNRRKTCGGVRKPIPMAVW